MNSYSEIINRKIMQAPLFINEANVVSWFEDFVKKTSNFIDIWKKKGGSKYEVDLNNGSVQASKDIKINILQAKKILHNSKVYTKCYPKTQRFLGSDHSGLKPNAVDKGDWDNLLIQLYVYTPKINYDGENYPVAVAILPQKKLELSEGYLTIESFEMSTMIKNPEIRNHVFESFIDKNKKSFKGVMVTTNKPGDYSLYSYKGNKFETMELEDPTDAQDNQNKDKEDNEVTNQDELTVLKLNF